MPGNRSLLYCGFHIGYYFTSTPLTASSTVILLSDTLMATYILTANPDYLYAALDEMRRLDRYARSVLEFDGIAVVEASLDVPAMQMRLQNRPQA